MGSHAHGRACTKLCAWMLQNYVPATLERSKDGMLLLATGSRVA